MSVKRRSTPPVWGTAAIFAANAGFAVGALGAVVTRADSLGAAVVGLVSLPLVGALVWGGVAGMRGGDERALRAGAAAASTFGTWTLSVACLAPLVLVVAARGPARGGGPVLVLAVVVGAALAVRATWRQSARIAAALRHADGEEPPGS